MAPCSDWSWSSRPRGPGPAAPASAVCLGRLACRGTADVSLVANFTSGLNLNYIVLSEVAHVSLLGEPVATAVGGIPNPWMLTGQASLLLSLLFLLDGGISAWRRGEGVRSLVLTDQPPVRRLGRHRAGRAGVLGLGAVAAHGHAAVPARCDRYGLRAEPRAITGRRGRNVTFGSRMPP